MREIVDFRIAEHQAQRFLRPEDGTVLGGDTRKLVLDTRDSLFARVGEIDQQLKKEGSTFFLGWSLRRQYTRTELEAAELLHLRVRATFEPEGERCGTEYDDTAGCRHCGVGARQLNELRLEASSLPRGKDVARTIAYSEVLFSARLVEAFREHGLTGARFHPVLRKGGKGVIGGWYQLEVCSRPLEVVSPTRFGIDPFDEDAAGRYRCPLGHVAGLNLLSEPWVKRKGDDGADICSTRQQVGPRSQNRGVFRPAPLLLISPRLKRLLEQLNAKGFELERAHLGAGT
jgi:hypothetical protein